MAFTRNLFLGVYASNGFIRWLFLPLCYLLLTSPFLYIILRRYSLYTPFLEAIPKHWTTPDILPQVFVSLIAFCLATRVISGKNLCSANGGQRRVQLIPYWVPGLRHLGNVVSGGERWFKRVRDTSITDVFAYSLAGAKHNVILSPQLLEEALKNQEVLDEAEIHTWFVPGNTFLLPSAAKKQYLQLRPAISEALQKEIFQGEHLKELLSSSLEVLSQTLPDLISFNSSIVDQLPWERVSDIELTDGTEEAECELYTLINEYLCAVIIPPIIGEQFSESYQLLATDLATINQSFYLLALGLPRWVPFPGLPGASFARKRLLQNLTDHIRSIPGPASPKMTGEVDGHDSDSETDAESPTPLSALNKLFYEHNLPVQARAAIVLELIHSIVSEAVPLAFWTLLHIYSSSSRPIPGRKSTSDEELSPLEQIIRETKSWAEGVQPPSIHPAFPSPPRITFKSSTQLSDSNSFPYLRSCIEETCRLYSAPLRTSRLRKTLILAELSSTTKPAASSEKIILDVGSYIDFGLSATLINTSVANHLDAEKYKHDRFLVHDGNSATHFNALASTTLPTPTAPLSIALVTAFVSGVSQLWDILPAPKKSLWEQAAEAAAAASGEDTQERAEMMQLREKKEIKSGEREKAVWRVPGTRDGGGMSGMRLPAEVVRVRFRRREGLPGLRRDELKK
ncbi:hypothetical protein GQ43DRAFT_477048 [Delitschia confertaspora ATCC 74209]|uniref:Cytochrome P450 n=1 Tax=Delitschia confertaspora ATCC 74209 TaxID=1513339 RepID=A0A9P4N008_9PLEO|nr:hypothetical protein GQ43DRAFT_477048 [Delitschia confertaspora ATCC 74209]